MRNRAVTCCLTIAGLLPGGGQAFSPAEITFWVGSGTNEAALVVDWHDGEDPDALAWGFRWDGAATAGDLIDAVAAADTRLAVRFHAGYPGTVVFGLGYDADGDGGRFAAGFPLPGKETGYALDPDDRYREGWNHGYWSLWRGAGNPYGGGDWSYAGSGFGLIQLTNGAWVGWGFDPDFSSSFGGLDDQPRTPQPASSPYAAAVISFVPGPDGPSDWVSATPLTNAAVALGRPTVDSTGGGLPIPVHERTPVVPAYPPFRHFEIVGLGTGGELVVSFDHPVEDDPLNPYGADFIVFGNTLQELSSGEWTNGSPHDYTMGTFTGGDDEGLVSVSQDGTNWFTFAAGPFADTVAPTLGRRFDPDHPDPALGVSNAWWGAPTDPRWPLDPVLGPGAFAGLTLAEMCRAYGRSAGGTAFDLGTLPLPPDPGTGRKWFRFLRVERQVWHPEIDALSDVAPAGGYEGWQLDHFTFWQRTNQVVCGEAGDADGDGCTNLLEYVTGRDPWITETEPLLEAGTAIESNVAYFVVSYDRRAELIDTVAVVEKTADFVSWSAAGIDQAHVVTPGTGDLVRVEARIPAEDVVAAVRLRAYRP